MFPFDALTLSLANWLFSSPKRISLVVLACVLVGAVVDGVPGL